MTRSYIYKSSYKIFFLFTYKYKFARGISKILIKNNGISTYILITFYIFILTFVFILNLAGIYKKINLQKVTKMALKLSI